VSLLIAHAAFAGFVVLVLNLLPCSSLQARYRRSHDVLPQLKHGRLLFVILILVANRKEVTMDTLNNSSITERKGPRILLSAIGFSNGKW